MRQLRLVDDLRVANPSSHVPMQNLDGGDKRVSMPHVDMGNNGSQISTADANEQYMKAVFFDYDQSQQQRQMQEYEDKAAESGYKSRFIGPWAETIYPPLPDEALLADTA